MLEHPQHRFPVMNAVVPMAKPSPAGQPSRFRMEKKTSDRAEIYIYGLIGTDWFGEGTSAKSFADQLKALGTGIKTIDLRINSEGGDVFAGKAIYSLLTQHKATVISHVDGLAASAASLVACAGNEIEIAEGGFIMIHNAWTWAQGGADDMRRCAELLDGINATLVEVYVARTGKSQADIKKWMDDETWMNGTVAKERGFADRVVENLKVAAAVQNTKKFKNLPAALYPRRAIGAKLIADMKAAASR